MPVRLAIAFVALNILDAAMTSWAVQNGHSELNPLMRTLINHSLWLFAGVKLFVAGAAAWYLWNRDRVKTLRFGVWLYAIILIWNAIALVINHH